MHREPYQSERKALSFFPSAPVDAMIFSRCIAYHKLSACRSIGRTKEILFGNQEARTIDAFGINISKLSQVIPRFSSMLDFLLERCTLFGFYSAFLSPERKELWRRQQLFDGDGRFVNKYVTGLSGKNGFRLVKEHLHFCKECVLEDEHLYGAGHWRVVHQIPGVHHCPIHQIPLCGICKKCGRAAASEESWNFASERCPHCDSQNFEETIVPFSQPYIRFIKLCDLAVQGVHVGLSFPERVNRYYKLWTTLCGDTSMDSYIDNFSEIICEQWKVDTIEQLQPIINAPMDRKFLVRALSFQETKVCPASHLALTATIGSSKVYKKSLSR